MRPAALSGLRNASSRRQSKQQPGRHPRTPYPGYPGQVAHGCATAANKDMDVLLSGDPDTRGAVAPSEARLALIRQPGTALRQPRAG